MDKPISPEILQSSFLFKDASQDVLQDIAQNCQRMELAAGETLFEQDADSNAMYILEEGQIHVVRHYPDNYSMIIATEVPYYVIGELSLLANQPRTGRVVAVGDSNLIRIGREVVYEIFSKTPDSVIQALNHLGQRLYRLNLQVRESAIGDVSARVASVLLLLSNSQTGDLPHRISIARLARATAIDSVVVEHLLNQWVTEGIISMNSQSITLHQIEALQNKAG